GLLAVPTLVPPVHPVADDLADLEARFVLFDAAVPAEPSPASWSICRQGIDLKGGTLLVMSDLMAVGAEHDALRNLSQDRLAREDAADHVRDIELLVLRVLVVEGERPVVGEAAASATQSLLVIFEPAAEFGSS